MNAAVGDLWIFDHVALCSCWQRAAAVVGGEQEETDDVERANEGLAGTSLSCGAEQLLYTDFQGISLPIESLS